MMTLFEKIQKKIEQHTTSTEFMRGIKCRQCGRMYIPPFKHQCCQACGTYIVEGYNKKDGWIISKNANIITIKVTHKLSSDIYEEV